MNTDDLMYAGPEPEFYYIVKGQDTDIAVPEGNAVGVDVETPEGVTLELFSNVYWTQCEEY